MPARPPCTTYPSCPGDGEGMCKMMAAGATAYYWPVTMEGDVCGNRTTITHPKLTRSTLISGITFVSPSVYISIESLCAESYAHQYNRTDCGRDKTYFMLTLDPTDVSTYVGPLVRNTATYSQLNLADLKDPTPVTAYFGLSEAPDCTTAPLQNGIHT